MAEKLVPNLHGSSKALYTGLVDGGNKSAEWSRGLLRVVLVAGRSILGKSGTDPAAQEL